MRKSIVITSIVLLAAMLGPGAAAAEIIAPGGGNAFGQHAASMAPEHPQDHGRSFGECVSTMAKTGACPHHA